MTHALRPDLVLDVATGDLLRDRAVVVEGERIAAVVAAADVPDGDRSATCPATPCCRG